MPSIRANRLDIAYEVDGDGPPLVLLHGALSTGASEWAACRAALAGTFRVFMPDARGHGATRWDPRNGVSIDDLAADVEAFAAALGLRAVHLAGYSLGGITALRLALRLAAGPPPAGAADAGPALRSGAPHGSIGGQADPGVEAAPAPGPPLRVMSLVLIGCDVRRNPAAAVFRAAGDPDRIARERPDWAADLDRLHGPVQGAGAWRRLAGALSEEMETYPLPAPAELRGVRMPVLVVCGDRDPFVPAAHVVELYRQLPRSRLLVLPGCGHEVPTLRPAGLARAIVEFCGGASGP